jgi:integrase
MAQTDSEYLTIRDWINEYLEEAENRFVEKTFKEKRSAFIRFVQSTGVNPDFSLGNISREMCRGFLKQQSRKRSGNAANKDRKNLAAAWKWGRENMTGWPEVDNPFRAVKKFPEDRDNRYVPPESDFWKVLEVSEGQDTVMLMTFLHTAGRRREIFNLKWSDVDFTNDKIRLFTRKRRGGHRENDLIPMTVELRDYLYSWKKERMTHKTADNEHVFVCLDDTPFCSEYFGRPFKNRQHLMKRLCLRAGVKPFGFHAIRHLTATILYHKGCSVSVIQAILRHKSPNTTAKYLHNLGLENLRSALDEGLRRPGKVIELGKHKGLKAGAKK